LSVANAKIPLNDWFRIAREKEKSQKEKSICPENSFTIGSIKSGSGLFILSTARGGKMWKKRKAFRNRKKNLK
jgi:hypothetical protein